MASHEEVITELLTKNLECSECLLTWAQDEVTRVKEGKRALETSWTQQFVPKPLGRRLTKQSQPVEGNGQ